MTFFGQGAAAALFVPWTVKVEQFNCSPRSVRTAASVTHKHLLAKGTQICIACGQGCVCVWSSQFVLFFNYYYYSS